MILQRTKALGKGDMVGVDTRIDNTDDHALPLHRQTALRRGTLPHLVGTNELWATVGAQFKNQLLDLVATLSATYPYYVVRLLGGLLYLGGMLIMAWNVVKTVQAGRPEPVRIPAVVAHA